MLTKNLFWAKRLFCEIYLLPGTCPVSYGRTDMALLVGGKEGA